MHASGRPGLGRPAERPESESPEPERPTGERPSAEGPESERPGSRRWRLGLVVLGALALAVRVGYVLAYKHPVSVGGDAYYYHYGANLLVDGRGFIDAYRFHNGVIAQTADHPPGTILVLAAASALGMRSFFWHQLELCALGSVTVVVIAVIARRLAGPRAGVIAGIIAAAYPNLWFNDAMVMSETVVQLTTALAVLAAYRWWDVPTRRRAAVLGVAVAACALSRAEAVLFIPLLVAPLILLDRRRAWRERVVEGLVAAVVAGAVLAPWVGYNLYRFEQPVTISTGFDPTAAVSNCDKVYYGEVTGYWWRPCILALPVPTHGDISTQEAQYRRAALHYISNHKRRLPAVVAARVGRTWGLFRPVQQIRLDTIETREIGFSKVGLAMFYALAVATALGVWLMRRRRVPVSPIMATIAVVTFATAITFGQTRYRASAEVVLVIGAAVAITALLQRSVGGSTAGGPTASGSKASGPKAGRSAASLPEAAPAVPGAAPSVDSEAVPARAVLGTAAVPGAAMPPGPAAVGAAQPRGVAAVANAQDSATPRPFFPCLDGLRGIAALSVVGVHTAFLSGLTGHYHSIGRFTARLEVGVWVFFLLSGFLLYRPFAVAHLAGRPGPAVLPYVRRRLLRIVPAYWVALTAAALFGAVDGVHGWKGIVVYFGFLQIYDSHRILHGIPAAWTLCIEMSYYLVLPLYAAAVAVLGSRDRSPAARLRTEMAGVVALIVASELWKLWIYSGAADPHNLRGSWLPAYLDLFAVGMGLAIWSAHCPRAHDQPAVVRHRAFPWATWAAAGAAYWLASVPLGLPVAPAFTAGLGQSMGRHLLFGAVALGLVLPGVVGPQDRGAIRRLLRARPVAFAGLVSYGVYLWHELVLTLIFRYTHRRFFGIPFGVLTASTVAGSLVLATLSYLVVERPCMRTHRARERQAPPGTERPSEQDSRHERPLRATMPGPATPEPVHAGAGHRPSPAGAALAEGICPPSGEPDPVRAGDR